MLRGHRREWETLSGLGVGRIPAGSLEEVALEPSLKGMEDCCSRDGGRLLWVTKAWEQKKEFPFEWEKT